MTPLPRLVVTPGEPAGVGPDLVIKLAGYDWPFQMIAVADPDMLSQRAEALGMPLAVTSSDLDTAPMPHRAGTLPVDPITCPRPVTAGNLDPGNATYVRTTLARASDLCLAHRAHALVTGPVHKATLTQAGEFFTGHTNYLAKYCGSPPPVMLLTSSDGRFRVALATMHLPLGQVPDALSVEGLCHVFQTTANGLARDFGIASPRLLVTGLNPHAGEAATLGDEEYRIIEPAIRTARDAGIRIEGPLSADTIFVETNRTRGDVVVAMYHDQGLPVIKYAAFGCVVNVTLGLPIVRTSVDHGTAVELAGTGRAETGSLSAALQTAASIVKTRGA